MRTFQSPQTESSRRVTLHRRLCRAARRLPRFFALCAALLAAYSLFAGTLLTAQTSSAPSRAAAPAQKTISSHKVNSHKQSAAARPEAKPAPAPAPVPPKAPNWPANDLPAEASVVWDSHGLLIVASNSSLAQILKEVSTETGGKVEGMDADERVFGTFGPGPARDVLSRLLDGSAYNVVMIGDQGQGAPRHIVLSPRSTVAAAAPLAANRPSPPVNEDVESDQPQQQPEPPQPEYERNSTAPAVPASPQEQIMQEMQARQLQRQQEQTQNSQQNPQN